jgi:hypothetical protein
MRKTLFAALLALPLSAEAAITFVACSTDDSGGVTSLTVSEPSGTAQNDVLVAFAVRGSNTDDGDWVDPADWTQGDLQDETLGNADGQLYWGYKVRGAGAGDALTWTFGGTAAGMTLHVCAFRGVDTSTPIDVTYADGSHYNSNEDAVNTAAQPITTVTDNAWILLMQAFTQEVDAACGGEPSGYTLRQTTAGAACSLGNSRHATIYSKEKASAGVETPGSYTHTDTGANADGRNYTIALRPAGAAFAFTVGPNEAPATNGFTISGTLVGSGTLTVEAVWCNPGDAVPNNTELEAGQCGGGNAALANASEVWTTGVGNDFLLTSSNKPVRADVYVAGTNGTDDTSVTSLLDQDRSIRAGFLSAVMASHSTTGICNLDSYFNPDCADGDVFEYEDDANENANCNALIEPDGDLVFTPVSAGDCNGRLSIEISYQDVSSATTGLFTAPTTGNFTTDDTIYVNNVAPDCPIEPENTIVVLVEDVAMTAIDLIAHGTCFDAESDALTFTVTGGTLPVGTALGGTGNKDWTGTPTTENEAGVLITITATDIAGDFDTFQFTVYVVNTWTVPDLHNLDITESGAAVVAAAPWRAFDPGVAITGYNCGTTETFLDVVNQSPTAASQATPFQSIGVNLAGAILPDLTGMSEAAAVAAIEALCP